MSSAPFSLSPSAICLSPHVRPPWPDEFPRMADAFPKFPRDQALRPLLLLSTAGGVERIVGLAGVLDPVDAVAGLTLAVRPRFLAGPGFAILLEAAIQVARDSGATRLITTDDLRPGNPHLAALEQNGFTVGSRQGEGVQLVRPL